MKKLVIFLSFVFIISLISFVPAPGTLPAESSVSYSSYLIERDISDCKYDHSALTSKPKFEILENPAISTYVAYYGEDAYAMIQVHKDNIGEEEFVDYLNSLGKYKIEKRDRTGKDYYFYLLEGENETIYVWIKYHKIIVIRSENEEILEAYLDKWPSTMKIVGVELCKDSDNGKNFYLAGYVYVGEKKYHDSCVVKEEEKIEKQECVGENCYVKEMYCSDGKVQDKVEFCPNGCYAGACHKVKPTEKTGPIDLPENGEDKNTGEINEKAACNGCALDGRCYYLGYRKEGKYCSDDGEFKEQGDEEISCENHFECKSNVCVSGGCVSGSLLKRVIEWLKGLFS